MTRTGRRTLSFSLVLALSIVQGCASAGGMATGSNPDLLTGEEISDPRFATAFEAVESLRPRWLRSRPNVSLSNDQAYVIVYVDGVRRGGVEALQSLGAPTVERMEWIDATTATQRWGTGHSVGAIAVQTRRGG